MINFLEKVKTWWKDRKLKKAKFSTHACPKCKKWEHEGNKIYTEIYCDHTDKRTCTNCGYIWRTLFSPAGHAWIKEYDWDGDKFVENEVRGKSCE